MLRQALVRLGFGFADEARERQFVERFVLIHLRTAQVFLVLTGILFGGFFIYDRAVDPLHWRNVLVLRELVLTPVIFAAAAALLFRPLQPYLETIVVIALTVCLAGFAVICANLDHGFRYGAGGMLLIYFGGAAMFPLRLGYLIPPSVVALASYLGLEAWLHHPQSDILIVNGSLVGTGIIIGALATAGRELAARREFQTDEALEQARARVDDLLHSMLPREIVTRIQAGETTIADIHGEVSIAFADLVGFTELSRRLSPSQLVDLLNKVFSRFDAAASRLGIEKIKTIGDAYMAVGGLSSQGDARDHADQMAQFAFAMRDITADLSRELDLPINVRIGVHVGPVVAGVIGMKKPAFDCWGDAVNMASRLEHASGPGAILLSEPAAARLKDRYAVEPRGDADLKGIGRSSVFLLGRRLAPA